MSSEDTLYYLLCTKTDRYHSMFGMVEDKESASKFTELQVKRRLGVAKTHKKSFKEKLFNNNLKMVPVVEVKMGELIINSKIAYSEDDILSCDATFYFEKDIVKKFVVYSAYRNFVKIPDVNKGALIKVVLNVIRLGGKVVK